MESFKQAYAQKERSAGFLLVKTTPAGGDDPARLTFKFHDEHGEVLYEHAFAGAGDTVPPTLISLPLTVLRIPLAWLLSKHTSLGLDGIWLAIALSTIAKGIILFVWFRLGHWQRRLGVQVIDST